MRCIENVGRFFYSKAEKGKFEKRKVYLDILRVIAILGVLFCHTGSAGFHHYQETENITNYWIGIFLFSTVQYCIPLFFMITGALLINREESISYVYKHRVLRMVLVIFLIVLFQYYWNYKNNPAIGFDRKTYFRIVFEGSAATPHWFLYAYLSFLLILPFLQRLVKVIPDKSWFLYVFLAHEVINGFFPILAYYQEWGKTKLELPMFPEIIVCSLMGYFIECRSEDIFYKKRNVMIVIAASFLLTLEIMHVNHISIPEKHVATFGAEFAAFYAIAIFVTVRYICHRWNMPAVLKKIFCFGGVGVFGTYLFEGQLRDFFYPVYTALQTRIYAYPACFVWILTCVLAGIIISNIVKRIPFVGKLI